MRITVDIADDLVVKAKRLATARHTSLDRVVADGLRKYLAEYKAEAVEPAYEIPPIDAGELLPGVDLNDTSALREIE